MRISDWSSDVCSSDLAADAGPATRLFRARTGHARYLSTPILADLSGVNLYDALRNQRQVHGVRSVLGGRHVHRGGDIQVEDAATKQLNLGSGYRTRIRLNLSN